MSQPKFLDTPLYALLHKDDIEGFNRDLNAEGIDFTDAYFRSADLRGLDLRSSSMEGASLAHAQISGAYFPPELTADEILMSVNFGTRLRYRTK
jgi:uncharacterized protein YjbI with pentapeptide repeats